MRAFFENGRRYKGVVDIKRPFDLFEYSSKMAVDIRYQEIL